MPETVHETQTNMIGFQAATFISSLAIAASLLLNGCAVSTPASFYMLHAIQNTDSSVGSTRAESGLSVGVGPITIPDYLQRPQMVTRPTASALEFSEYHQWGEALEKNLSRVLVENLSILLPSERVFDYPWQAGLPIEFQVVVDVLHLEKMPDNSVLLDARWQVRGGGGEKTLVTNRSKWTIPLPSPGFESIASAESRAVEALSREIARELKSLPRSGTH